MTAYTKYKRRLVLGLALVMAVVVWPRASDARKKAVVLPFSGPGGAKARAGVIRSLRRKVTLLQADTYRNEATTAGVDGSSGPGLVTVCSKLQCDVVVKGSVSRRRRTFRIAVTMLNGGTGEPLGRKGAVVRGLRRVTAAGAAIGRNLLPLVNRGAFKMAPQPEPVAVAEATTPEPSPEPTPALETQTQVTRKAEAGPAGKAGLFDLSAGIGFSMRSYKLEGADAAQNRAYDGGAFSEINLKLELYPLTPFVKNFARNIGVGVGFCHHLSISTNLETSQGTQEIDTSSWELLFDLLVRWPILSKPTTPVVKLLLGGGLRNFTLGANDILPSFKYRYLRFGLEGVVPFGTTLAAGHIGFDVRPLLGVGEDAVEAFGYKDSGIAWSIRAGIGGHLALGLLYEVDFEYLRFSADFEGRANVTTPPALVRTDPTSGGDGFIRLWFSVGYRFSL